MPEVMVTGWFELCAVFPSIYIEALHREVLLADGFTGADVVWVTKPSGFLMSYSKDNNRITGYVIGQRRRRFTCNTRSIC